MLNGAKFPLGLVPRGSSIPDGAPRGMRSWGLGTMSPTAGQALDGEEDGEPKSTGQGTASGLRRPSSGAAMVNSRCHGQWATEELLE